MQLQPQPLWLDLLWLHVDLQAPLPDRLFWLPTSPIFYVSPPNLASPSRLRYRFSYYLFHVSYDIFTSFGVPAILFLTYALVGRLFTSYSRVNLWFCFAFIWTLWGKNEGKILILANPPGLEHIFRLIMIFFNSYGD